MCLLNWEDQVDSEECICCLVSLTGFLIYYFGSSANTALRQQWETPLCVHNCVFTSWCGLWEIFLWTPRSIRLCMCITLVILVGGKNVIRFTKSLNSWKRQLSLRRSHTSWFKKKKAKKENLSSPFHSCLPFDLSEEVWRSQALLGAI